MSLQFDFSADGSPEYRFLLWQHRTAVSRFAEALGDPKKAQLSRLRKIISLSAYSDFGEAHGLHKVANFDDFRSALPIRTYEDHLPWLQRISNGEKNVLVSENALALMETSGTTGKAKHLPVSQSWVDSIKTAQALWILAMVRAYPQIARGKALTMVSAAQHDISSGGLAIGSNTGRMYQQQNWLVRQRYCVPYQVFELESSSIRQYALLRFALQETVTSLTTANPSMVLLLCRRLLEWQRELSKDLRAGTLRHGPAADLAADVRRQLESSLRPTAIPFDWHPTSIWPLSLVSCWKGGPATFFVDQLPAALGAPVPIWEVGVTASEGYFAIPLGLDWAGGALWTLGHLLEFMDAEGQVYWAWELEKGQRYRMIITTEAGLFRYDLADEIEVVDFCQETPVIRFVGKSGRFLNSVGEKVSESQVSSAVREACRQRENTIVGFTARIKWQEIPYIEIAVEGTVQQDFAKLFDRCLQQLNIEYASKRESGRLQSVQMVQLPPNTYLRYREYRVANGAPEGQIKDPVLALTDKAWEQLLSLR